jgi:YD repeat-containing protein
MKLKLWSKIGLIFILSIALLIGASLKARADEVKYIYDDLGRLHQVIDPQGNVATYNYDAVGNLISITRSTGISAPQITGISPNYAFGGDTVNVTISGNGLIGTSISTNNPGITISNVNATVCSGVGPS